MLGALYLATVAALGARGAVGTAHYFFSLAEREKRKSTHVWGNTSFVCHTNEEYRNMMNAAAIIDRLAAKIAEECELPPEAAPQLRRYLREGILLWARDGLPVWSVIAEECDDDQAEMRDKLVTSTLGSFGSLTHSQRSLLLGLGSLECEDK